MNRKALRQAALKAANDIVSSAKTAGRTHLTDSERQTVQAKLDEVDRLDKEIELEEKDAAVFGKLMDIDTAVAEQKEAGDALTQVDQALRTKSTIQVNLPRKVFSSTSVGEVYGGPHEEVINTPPPAAAVSLRDLFTVRKVLEPLVRTYTIGDMTGIDIVAEGALKPEITGSITPVDAALVKLAGRFKTTMEFDTDALDIRKALLLQATFELIRRENKLVLDTLAATSGIQVKTGAAGAVLDLLEQAQSESIALTGVEPTFLVISPTDLAAMYQIKASSSARSPA